MRLPQHDRRCTCETCLSVRGQWQWQWQWQGQGQRQTLGQDATAPLSPTSPSPPQPPPQLPRSVPHVSSSNSPLPWEPTKSPQPTQSLPDPSNERMSQYHMPATLPVPGAPASRVRVRHSFDVFADQLLSLREIALTREAHTGQRVRLGDVVQEALDGFIARSTTDLLASPASPASPHPPGQLDPQHPSAPFAPFAPAAPSAPSTPPPPGAGSSPPSPPSLPPHQLEQSGRAGSADPGGST